MPTPRSNESQQEFVSRCIGDPEAQSTFPDPSQRAAFCYSQYRRRRFTDASYEQQIRSITRDMEPRIRAAFLASMRDIKSRAQMGILRDALRSGDIQQAINSLNIDAGVLSDLQALIVETYGKSGVATITNGTWIYPDGTRAVVRWNALSPRAEEYARTLSSTLVQNINEETITAVR